jgi:hypothetical protein
MTATFQIIETSKIKINIKRKEVCQTKEKFIVQAIVLLLEYVVELQSFLTLTPH